MECRERTVSLASWTHLCEWLVVVFFGLTAVEVTADKNCPVVSSMLYAYVDESRYEFSYTFDPIIKTNIDLLDRLFTSDDEVICDWVVRAKADHTARVLIEDFRLTPASRTRDGDCLRVYDGKTSEGKLLEKLCGGDITPEAVKAYSGSDRYLYLEYTQGEITGERSFVIVYTAEPDSKELLIKIAAIVCGSVVAVAIVFLAFKFTHYCRPCRKRCCPNQPMEGGMPQRELRPLSPDVLAPPSGGGGGARADTNVPQRGAAQRHPPQAEGGRPGGEGEEEGEDWLPVDEAPPSYDSIFGSSEEQYKAN
ncbi:uncharacterized protein LOC143291196 [Babylonia areolata]|uniref:uncharacterized protein LOC143291196 n=1 Tax=Babylonia areolata TaxID=304850 RepID=UPI003FD0E687